MNVYLVTINDFMNPYEIKTHIDSVWQSMTNAQCHRDRLNNEFDTDELFAGEFQAEVLTMPIRDFAHANYF